MKIRNYNLGKYIVPEETKNGVCLEIGANVGSFTEKYASHFKLIHFYEPITDCYNIVKDKTQSKKHIVGFNLAGYNESGQYKDLILHKNEDSGSTALKTEILNHEWENELAQKVKTISLKDMIKNLNVNEIDYCKSDCETSEYHIFINSDLTKIKYLALELHHQIGIKKWNELLNYISKTHNLINGDCTYAQGINRELLFKRR
jgi:FkbM family methyltransferase